MKRTNCEFVGRVDEKAPETPFYGRFRSLFSGEFSTCHSRGSMLLVLESLPLEVRRCCLKAGVGSVYLITDTSTGMHHVGSAYAIQGAFSGGESGRFQSTFSRGIFQAFSAVKWLGKFHIEKQAAALHPPSRPASGNGGPRLTRAASGLSGAPQPLPWR